MYYAIDFILILKPMHVQLYWCQYMYAANKTADVFMEEKRIP